MNLIKTEGLKLFKLIGMPILGLLLLTILLFWANYPIGTYDLSDDIWFRGSALDGFMGIHDFSNDYFMSNKIYGYYLEMYLHIPLFKLFSNYEKYISFLHAALFFTGASLLYIACYLLTRSNIISFVSSLIFSSSSVWFFSGDIFSFIPIWSTLGRTVAFVYYCALFVAMLYIEITPIRFSILVLATSAMTWIHGLTFLGPGIATVAAYYLLFILPGQYTVKQKIVSTLFSIILAISVLSPYYLSVLASRPIGDLNDGSEMKSEKSLSITQKEIFLKDIDDFRSRVRRDHPPASLFHYRQDFKSVERYNYLFYLALLSFLFIGKNRNIKFLVVVASLSFLFNFCLLTFNYEHGYRFNLEILDRNSKWLYFYSFVIVVASYPNWQEFLSRFNKKYSIVLLNVIFCVLLTFIFAPHVRRSFTHNTILQKLVRNAGICESSGSQGRLSVVSSVIKYCPDKDNEDIVRINNDVEEAAFFMNKMPSQLTFVGPGWLRYKAGRNMSFVMDDGINYLYHMDQKYFTWKEQKDAYMKLTKMLTHSESKNEYYKEMRNIGGDFLFLERFEKTFIDGENRYAFVRRNIDLKGLPVIFKNDSFAIIDLRNKRA